MYKIGIIGAGSIVETCHLPVLKNNKEISVKWIFDLNSKRSSLMSKMYDVPSLSISSDWRHEIDNIDICLLTIPYGARKEYIKHIATCNKALYVEKPFAISLKEHEEYSSLFPSSKLAIGFQRRFYQSVWHLKSIVESKIFGQLRSLTYNQGYFNLKGGSSYISDSKLSGGGVLIESAIHALDQIMIITEAKEFHLKHVSQIIHKGIDYETNFEGEISANNGDTYNIDANISSIKNFDNGLTMEFDNVTLKSDLSPIGTIWAKTACGDKFEILKISDCKFAKSVNESFFLFWKSFLTAINTNQENLTSATSSKLTTTFLEEIYKHGKSR